jgi:hypothetical protein
MGMVDSARTTARITTGQLALAWATFFLIAFGLGYPTVNRYDARTADGDVVSYYKAVVGQPPDSDDGPLGFRVLVPVVARPFYHVALGRLGSWNPVFFGLLVSNSIFTATAALFLLLIGFRLGMGSPLAWLGCTIFLLNFVVSNFWLSGMVDSSEGCLLLAVAWCLFSGRWWALPFLGVLCAMAKQSTMPFAVVFAAVWWLSTSKPRRIAAQIALVAAMGLTGMVTLILVYRAVGGQFLAPWTMASFYNRGSYLENMKALLLEGRFWYAFVWLAPLGVWRLNRLPRQWVMASLAATLFALFMAILSHLGGTVNRAIFNVAGPILSVSTALFLASDSGTPATMGDSEAGRDG